MNTKSSILDAEYFTRDDDPVRALVYGHEQLQKFTGKEPMRVTKDRVDAWLIKGFEGLKDHLLNRSGCDEKISQDQQITIDRAILMLDACLNCNQQQTNENTDDLLVMTLTVLITIMHKRFFEMGLGPVKDIEKEKLKLYLQQLRVASAKFKGAA